MFAPTVLDGVHLFNHIIKVGPSPIIVDPGDGTVWDALGFSAAYEPVIKHLSDQHITRSKPMHWYSNMEQYMHGILIIQLPRWMPQQ